MEARTLPPALHHHRHLGQLHAHILRAGPAFVARSLVSNLISSIALLSSVNRAVAVFRHLHPAGISPSLLDRVFGNLSKGDKPENALLFYAWARGSGLLPTRFGFPPLLKASGRVAWSGVGREMHGVVEKIGFAWDPVVQTGLIGAYAGCGQLVLARSVFDKMSCRDAVSWTVMMDGYSSAKMYQSVVELFQDMMKKSSVQLDSLIIATVLIACGQTRNAKVGEELHHFILKEHVRQDSFLHSVLINMYIACGKMEISQKLFDEMDSEDVVVSTAMITGYSKIGDLDTARNIFDKIRDKDLISWSAMISGYAESEQPNEALRLFDEMKTVGIKLNHVAMLSVISACSNLGVLDRAKEVHAYADDHNLCNILCVNNALIDMYAKCGSLGMAMKIFDAIQERNVISWTSLINGLAIHGNGLAALELFKKMQTANVKPNSVTFVSLLYGCSHAGLVDEGRRIFTLMETEYHIQPKHEHYGCMVDLLGRANLLDEASKLIKRMPFNANVVIWGSLLNACRIHCNTKLGVFAATKLLELNPQHDGAYVLLSNIYAKANKWIDVRKVRSKMKKKTISKEKGYSWVEVKGEIHRFLVGDKSHPQSQQVYNNLNDIVSRLKLVGYVPNTSGVLADMDEEEKNAAILLHSEKLALSFVTLNASHNSCIHIVKNLRICEDCHEFMTWFSKVFNNSIIVRDRTRFHNFSGGVCSCNDYW